MSEENKPEITPAQMRKKWGQMRRWLMHNLDRIVQIERGILGRIDECFNIEQRIAEQARGKRPAEQVSGKPEAPEPDMDLSAFDNDRSH